MICRDLPSVFGPATSRVGIRYFTSPSSPSSVWWTDRGFWRGASAVGAVFYFLSGDGEPSLNVHILNEQKIVQTHKLLLDLIMKVLVFILQCRL